MLNRDKFAVIDTETNYEDELRIMQMMGHEISLYEVGRV